MINLHFVSEKRFGLVAQLGERRVRNAEVMGSNPTRSIQIEGTLMVPSICICIKGIRNTAGFA